MSRWRDPDDGINWVLIGAIIGCVLLWAAFAVLMWVVLR